MGIPLHPAPSCIAREPPWRGSRNTNNTTKEGTI